MRPKSDLGLIPESRLIALGESEDVAVPRHQLHASAPSGFALPTSFLNSSQAGLAHLRTEPSTERKLRVFLVGAGARRAGWAPRCPPLEPDFDS